MQRRHPVHVRMSQEELLLGGYDDDEDDVFGSDARDARRLADLLVSPLQPPPPPRLK